MHKTMPALVRILIREQGKATNQPDHVNESDTRCFNDDSNNHAANAMGALQTMPHSRDSAVFTVALCSPKLQSSSPKSYGLHFKLEINQPEAA